MGLSIMRLWTTLIQKRVGKDPWLVKVDMAKAYDKVEWMVLIAILEKHDFDKSFYNLIKECISTVTYSILVNGSPCRFSLPLGIYDKGTPCHRLCLLFSRIFCLVFWQGQKLQVPSAESRLLDPATEYPTLCMLTISLSIVRRMWRKKMRF